MIDAVALDPTAAQWLRSTARSKKSCRGIVKVVFDACCDPGVDWSYTPRLVSSFNGRFNFEFSPKSPLSSFDIRLSGNRSQATVASIAGGGLFLRQFKIDPGGDRISDWMCESGPRFRRGQRLCFCLLQFTMENVAQIKWTARYTLG